MSLAVVEKIAQQHRADGDALNTGLKSGDFLSIRPHLAITHENTASIFRKFKAIGCTKVMDARQSVFALHPAACPPDEQNLIQAFADEQGIACISLSDGGPAELMEQGFILPGAFVVAPNWSSNVFGAVGAIGTPVVRGDHAAIWATSEFWWQIPRSVQVELSGKLAAGVTGREVIQTLCQLYDQEEVLNAAVEFVGDGIATLDMAARMEISQGTSDWGATSGWFPADEVTHRFLKECAVELNKQGIDRLSTQAVDQAMAEALQPARDAIYSAKITLDLGQVSAQTASSPDSLERAIRWFDAASTITTEAIDIQDGFPKERKGRFVLLSEDNISSDAICEARLAKVEDTPTDLSGTALLQYDPAFAQQVRSGDIVIAGANFGCGPSREHAVTCLQAAGVTCIIASSYSQTFLRNAFNNGFLCLESPEFVEHLQELYEDQIEAGARMLIPGDSLEIDFTVGRIRHHDQYFWFPSLGEVPQTLVVEGGLENLIRLHLGLGS
jgi:aconitase A